MKLRGALAMKVCDVSFRTEITLYVARMTSQRGTFPGFPRNWPVADAQTADYAGGLVSMDTTLGSHDDALLGSLINTAMINR